MVGRKCVIVALGVGGQMKGAGCCFCCGIGISDGVKDGEVSVMWWINGKVWVVVVAAAEVDGWRAADEAKLGAV